MRMALAALIALAVGNTYCAELLNSDFEVLKSRLPASKRGELDGADTRTYFPQFTSSAQHAGGVDADNAARRQQA